MSVDRGVVSRRSFLGVLAAGATTLASPGVLALELTPEVFRVKDPANMSSLEEKHVPRITVPTRPSKGEPTPVNITVEHVMEVEHHIERLELYWEGMLLTTIPLTPGLMDCRATVFLKFPGPGRLTVRELCNKHGLWEAEARVEVS